MAKFRVKCVFKEWVRSTSGSEYPSSGVEIMYMTVISDNASQARMEAERRLKLMPECSEGWTEDIEEVK
jgi:hypothetical protein